MLDLNFVNPFIKSAVEAIEVQGGLKVEGGKPFLKGRETMPQISIAGQLGLTSNKFKGVISISFEERFYLRMMSNMLGEEFTELTSDIQDGAAELLNIIYGGAKSALNPMGYTFERAIPTVVRGSDLHLGAGNRFQPTIVIPLRSDSGFAFIEISVETV